MREDLNLVDAPIASTEFVKDSSLLGEISAVSAAPYTRVIFGCGRLVLLTELFPGLRIYYSKHIGSLAFPAGTT